MARAVSEAKPAPAKPARTYRGNKYAPSKRPAILLKGNRASIFSGTFKLTIPDAFSTEIGIGGKSIIRAVRSPKIIMIIVAKRPTIIIKKPVLNNFPVVRNLVTATVILKKRTGNKKYLPTRKERSVKNCKSSFELSVSNGKKRAIRTPRIHPIKYLIQIFIL